MASPICFELPCAAVHCLALRFDAVRGDALRVKHGCVVVAYSLRLVPHPVSVASSRSFVTG